MAISATGASHRSHCLALELTELFTLPQLGHQLGEWHQSLIVFHTHPGAVWLCINDGVSHPDLASKSILLIDGLPNVFLTRAFAKRCVGALDKGRAHQLSSLSKCITAGTRRRRMTVASRASEKIMPNAMYFIITMSLIAKAAATTIMIAAAAVIMPPVCAVPYLIAWSVEAPLWRASTMRETRKTS